MNNPTEIVGILIKGTIYTGIDAIKMVKLTNDYDQLVSRDEAKFMHSADLGIQWTNLMNCPTLFFLDKEKKPYWNIPEEYW